MLCDSSWSFDATSLGRLAHVDMTAPDGATRRYSSRRLWSGSTSRSKCALVITSVSAFFFTNRTLHDDTNCVPWGSIRRRYRRNLCIGVDGCAGSSRRPFTETLRSGCKCDGLNSIATTRPWSHEGSQFLQRVDAAAGRDRELLAPRSRVRSDHRPRGAPSW